MSIGNVSGAARSGMRAQLPQPTKRVHREDAMLMKTARGRTMTDDTLLRRIVVDPAIFSGKPIIRGMRISVELVLSLLAQGQSADDIRADYPELEPDDIRACIAYAHAVVANESLDAVAISGR
jgi:uncharacterized protein (DUF433 family)